MRGTFPQDRIRTSDSALIEASPQVTAKLREQKHFLTRRKLGDNIFILHKYSASWKDLSAPRCGRNPGALSVFIKEDEYAKTLAEIIRSKSSGISDRSGIQSPEPHRDSGRVLRERPLLNLRTFTQGVTGISPICVILTIHPGICRARVFAQSVRFLCVTQLQVSLQREFTELRNFPTMTGHTGLGASQAPLVMSAFSACFIYPLSTVTGYENVGLGSYNRSGNQANNAAVEDRQRKEKLF
ncbi:hypothetical protein Bbelb_172340 [Branchiostoma belcheri]|nr:hypothetical protein Bbelb_172340 [Branchiostoma belcheri]